MLMGRGETGENGWAKAEVAALMLEAALLKTFLPASAGETGSQISGHVLEADSKRCQLHNLAARSA